jgi:exonuclease SbcC
VKDIAAHRSSITALERSICDYEQLMGRTETGLFEPICTMCGRLISEHDAGGIKRHAEARRRELEDHIEQLHVEIARHERSCAESDVVLKTLRSRLDRINELSGRIANSANAIEAQRTLVDDAQLSLAKRMAVLERAEPVTNDEIAAWRDQLTCERAVESLAASFSEVRASLQTQLDRVSRMTEQLAELGDVQFDPAALERMQGRREGAKTATDRLEFIAGQSPRRPQHDRVIAEAEGTRALALEQVGKLQESRAEHQIEEFAIEDAQDEMSQHLNEQKRQLHLRDTSRNERSKIVFELGQIDKDKERLAETARRAEEARVLADDLDHMYTEFNDFERFVARRVKPQLEDMTSELVRVVTESKYESVVLDDDYGLKVFDGDLGPYPLEHFSGGERDVVALAARLALSRLIGSQAANPPSFLVLDEVFGSLDRDRRTNLLDLLGSLAGSAESFQQLFVISHVDDVRVSSAFNEVWRITELPDGSSRLENLNATGAAEDF